MRRRGEPNKTSEGSYWQVEEEEEEIRSAPKKTPEKNRDPEQSVHRTDDVPDCSRESFLVI